MRALAFSVVLALCLAACRSPTSVDTAAKLQWARLGEPYPNPFQEVVAIPVQLFRTEHVEIVVQSPAGQTIRTLVRQDADPGRYVVHWEGRNGAGVEVNPGPYFITLRTSEGIQSRLVRKE